MKCLVVCPCQTSIQDSVPWKCSRCMKALLLSLCAAALFAVPGSPSSPDISLVRVPNGGIQPQAVTDRRGTLHLLYYSGTSGSGDLYYVKSSDSARTWSAP